MVTRKNMFHAYSLWNLKKKKIYFFFNFNNPATTNIISKEFNNLVLVTQLY